MGVEKRIRYALKSRNFEAPTQKSLKQRDLRLNELTEIAEKTGFPVAYLIGELDEIEKTLIKYHRFIDDGNNLVQYCDRPTPYPVKVVIGNMFGEIRRYSSKAIHVNMEKIIGDIPNLCRDRTGAIIEEMERIEILYKEFLEDKKIPEFGRKNLPEPFYISTDHQKAMVGLYKTYYTMVVHEVSSKRSD